MTVQQLFKKAVSRISMAGIPDAETEAYFLLAHLLKMNRAQLTLAGKQVVSDDILDKFEFCLSRRLKRIPLAYILGEQEFWSLPFIVCPDVLIPRPETEQLLDVVLQVVTKYQLTPSSILDLGTGSGVIASVLALELPYAKVVAVDRSLSALHITKKNIAQHRLKERVFPLCSDWGKSVKKDSWDLIVSNPPYVATEVMDDLDAEVKTEPKSALDGGPKGMSDISRIVYESHSLLKKGGWLFIEIGYDQKQHVLDLFDSLALFSDVSVHHDYSGHPRILQARKLQTELKNVGA